MTPSSQPSSLRTTLSSIIITPSSRPSETSSGSQSSSGAVIGGSVAGGVLGLLLLLGVVLWFLRRARKRPGPDDQAQNFTVEGKPFASVVVGPADTSSLHELPGCMPPESDHTGSREPPSQVFEAP
ncbi:hypothetical protein AAL_07625 [Moelleriella libera RCEF 2490]|uniref:Uncharacterized protein n=1 Tax=Moelleriella libera RCEF 2490 TaxID=1081109 RepID=A0A167X7N0_9HYPO|nr:hypothetical protein AAL_07625 [Moelleriella libera RCEF 2490]